MGMFSRFFQKIFGPKSSIIIKPSEPIQTPIINPPVDHMPEPTSLASALKKELGGLYKDSQLEGFQIIISKFCAMGYTDIRWLAYCLATTLHETAFTMKPVREYGGEKYLRTRKYWPYVGQGYCQLTWKENYRKYGIVDNPDKALEPDFAAFVLIDGSARGIFDPPHSLSKYFNDHVDDPVGARYIINMHDCDEAIAGYHRSILRALKQAL